MTPPYLTLTFHALVDLQMHDGIVSVDVAPFSMFSANHGSEDRQAIEPEPIEEVC
jgi:hypothetical protein